MYDKGIDLYSFIYFYLISTGMAFQAGIFQEGWSNTITCWWFYQYENCTLYFIYIYMTLRIFFSEIKLVCDIILWYWFVIFWICHYPFFLLRWTKKEWQMNVLITCILVFLTKTVKIFFLHKVQHIFTSYEGNMYMCVDKETNSFLLCKEN